MPSQSLAHYFTAASCFTIYPSPQVPTAVVKGGGASSSPSSSPSSSSLPSSATSPPSSSSSLPSSVEQENAILRARVGQLERQRPRRYARDSHVRARPCPPARAHAQAHTQLRTQHAQHTQHTQQHTQHTQQHTAHAATHSPGVSQHQTPARSSLSSSATWRPSFSFTLPSSVEQENAILRARSLNVDITGQTWCF